MANQYTPKSRRAAPTVKQLIAWPSERLDRVRRAAKAAHKTVSEYVRDAADPPGRLEGR